MDALGIAAVIGLALWALFVLLAVGMCRAGALEDEAIEHYLDELYGDETPEFDRAAREWIAGQRRAT